MITFHWLGHSTTEDLLSLTPKKRFSTKVGPQIYGAYRRRTHDWTTWTIWLK